MTKSLSAITRLTCLVALSLSLSGCVSLLFGTKASPPRYTLEPIEIATRQATLPGRLILDDPQAEAALNTAQIAFTDGGLSYQYYTSGEWSDRAPRLFGIVLERSFQNSAMIANVGDRSTIAVGDYVLITDLREFNMQLVNKQITAEISYFARLKNGKGETLATREFSVSKPVAGKTLREAVGEFNDGLKELSFDTIEWVRQTIQTSE